MDDTPGYTEEAFACPRCKAQIGMVAMVYGREIGVRLPVGKRRYIMLRSLNGVCETCGAAIHFASAEAALRQILLELQSAKATYNPATG